MKKFIGWVGDYTEEFEFSDNYTMDEIADTIYNWTEQYFDWGFEEAEEEE